MSYTPWMNCPHCGDTLPGNEGLIVFASLLCNKCGKEYVVYKNEAMTRSDFLSVPSPKSPPTP
jgi:ribosomal protein S27E